ncbi:MAG: hypothetical protein KC643_28290 [Nitrospira sp.]|nr:hypothetical protein [Nitrospira sp.]MCA9469318.1 hypothetical protein [Nitrospira sp.]
MKKKIEISVFVRGVAKHLNQIYSGLYDLHRLGKIQLRLESGKSAEDIDEDREILKVMVRSLDEGKLQRICFDMGDGGRLRQKNVEGCDWYFKRGYYEPNFQNLPQQLKEKVLPYGLNYNCISNRGESFRIRLALKSIRNSGRTNLTTFKEALRLAISPFRFIDKNCYMAQSNYEVEPHEYSCPKVLFQSRVFDPDDFEQGNRSVIHELNEMRANITRALRSYFGSIFIGGIEHNSYSVKKYSDCLTPHSARQIDYLKTMKECLVCVSTIGLHKSTPWKMAEYLAASRCIVTENIFYELPVPLREGVNFFQFSTPEQCVKICEKILENPDLSKTIRQSNWTYYQKYVRPDAIVWRCLETAMQKS